MVLKMIDRNSTCDANEDGTMKMVPGTVDKTPTVPSLCVA